MTKTLLTAAFLAALLQSAALAQPIPSLADALDRITDAQYSQYGRWRDRDNGNPSSGYVPEDPRLQPGNRYRPEDSRLETPRQQRSNEFLPPRRDPNQGQAGYCFNGKCY